MSGWEKDYPNGFIDERISRQTPATAAVLNRWQDALYELKKRARNVLDYGAVGSGTVDDSGAINEAISEANANGGGGVYVPPDYIFGLGAPIQHRSSVHLFGESGYPLTEGSMLRILPETDIHAIETPSTVSWGSIRHLRIDCNGANQSAVTKGRGITGKFDHARIRDVQIVNCRTRALLLGDPTVNAGELSYLNVVEYCELVADEYGIYHLYENTDSWFLFNNLGGNLATSVNVLLSGGPTRWVGNHFNGTIQHNIVSDSDNAHFWNNLFEGSAQEAIKVTSAGFHAPSLKARWHVSDNHFSNCVTDGVGAIIKFDGDAAGKLENVIVADNLFMIGSADHLVELRDVQGAVIVGNSGPEAFSAAEPFNLVDTCTDVMIAGNTPSNEYAGTLTLTGPVVSGESWQAPVFQNGWVDVGGGAQPAGYRRCADGSIELRGQISTGAPPSVAFTLPAGYRPAAEERFAVIANGAIGEVRVATTGAVTVQVGSAVNTSLSGISFQPA